MRMPTTVEQFEKLRQGFEDWCEARSGTVFDPAGEYEVFRCKFPKEHGGATTLLIHRNAKGRLTYTAASLDLLATYVKEQKNASA